MIPIKRPILKEKKPNIVEESKKFTSSLKSEIINNNVRITIIKQKNLNKLSTLEKKQHLDHIRVIGIVKL